jgi:3-oxoacyl-[acyl-carrier protein] reductase
VKADISDYAESEALMQSAIDHFKKIDILINNAGITCDNLLARMKPQEWQQVIDTYLYRYLQLLLAMRPGW